MKYENKTD